jgi:hypothetical protein
MTDPDQPRCECDEQSSANPLFPDLYSYEEQKSWGHAPGECPSRSLLRLYRRGARILWLCSACNTRGDAPLAEPANERPKQERTPTAMPTDNRFPDNTDLLIRLLKVMVDKDKNGVTESEGSTLRDPMIVALVRAAYRELQDANKAYRKQMRQESHRD